MYKVLVVEDEALIRRGLVFRVDWTALGCAMPAEAADGQEGLRQIEALGPDLVITDVKMPVMDGIAMLEAGLQLHSFESIIISGYDEFAYAQTAMRLNVAEYLLKPVTIEQLEATIARLLEKIDQKAHYADLKRRAAQPGVGILPDLLADQRQTASRRVNALLAHIREQYAQRISLKELAQQMEASPSYLNAKFKKETGYPFNEFLNRYRIVKAMEALQTTDLRVYEVADRTGFSDYRYFSMVFKKYTGFSPSDFPAAIGVARQGPQEEGAQHD